MQSIDCRQYSVKIENVPRKSQRCRKVEDKYKRDTSAVPKSRFQEEGGFRRSYMPQTWHSFSGPAKIPVTLPLALYEIPRRCPRRSTLG